LFAVRVLVFVPGAGDGAGSYLGRQETGLEENLSTVYKEKL